MSKSKSKGTAAESAVVSFLRTRGWPHAERLALQGAHDRGDVTGTPGVVWEVKNCAELDLAGWLHEAEVERENAHADHGLVVAKPVGIGTSRVASWYAAMYAGDFQVLLAQASVPSGQVWIHAMSAAYKTGLRIAMRHVGDLAVAAQREFGIVEIAAKGIKDEQRWYTVLSMGHVVTLLARAGYGNG